MNVLRDEELGRVGVRPSVEVRAVASIAEDRVGDRVQ